MSGTNVVAEIGDTLNKEPIYQEKQPETDRENLYLRKIPKLGIIWSVNVLIQLTWTAGMHVIRIF